MVCGLEKWSSSWWTHIYFAGKLYTMPSAHDGRTRSGEPSKNFKAKLGTSNIVSYEDLLIAQYIDDIKRGPDVGNKSE